MSQNVLQCPKSVPKVSQSVPNCPTVSQKCPKSVQKYVYVIYEWPPRDHRFLSWKRDLRPPPAIRSDMGGHEAIRGHRRSFHYDDRKEAYLNPAGHAAGVPIRPGGQREISPAAARRSYDCSNIHPTFIEPCDR